MNLLRATGLLACAAICAGCGAASDVDAPPVVDLGTAGQRTTAASAEGYPIRLSWPAHRGQRGQFRGESEQARVKKLTRIDGSEQTESSIEHVTAKGIYEVVAVSAQGRATGVLFDVESLDADFGGAKPPIHLERAKVRIDRAEREEDARVTVDERPAEESLRGALDSVISLSVAKSPSDDEIFGTPERRSIGASWPIQVEIARRSLTEKLLRVPEGAVTGEMRLVGVDKSTTTGIECEELVGKMEVDPFEIVDGPEGATTERAKITVRTRALVPIAAELPRLEDEMTMSTEILLSLPGQGHLALTSRKATHSSYAPL